jgi:RNA polymerase sigma factor (sigma-70 family)
VNSRTDQQLLSDYAKHRLEAAFAELVRRHIDFVYSAALRMVRDTHLADDVTQAVFVALARNVRQLVDCAVLPGWLHRTTQNLAANAVRSDVRRRNREQEVAVMNELLCATPDTSWEHIAPHLDEALGELSEPDRDAVLLRYFKNHDLRTVGATLGISDDAAQKRVSRAVERLREFFVKRGVTTGASSLIAVISANGIHAAPLGLAATLSTAALAGAAAIATQSTVTTINWINLKSIAAVVAATLAAGTGTHLLQKREADRLRAQNRALLFEQSEHSQIREAELSATAAMNDELERLRNNQNELLRLRSEAGTLRRQLDELAKLREENRHLRESFVKVSEQAQPVKPDGETDLPRQLAIVKMNDARSLVLGLLMYSSDNQNRLPADFGEITRYLTNTQPAFSGSNQFELVLQGSITSVTNPSAIIAVREKEPALLNGKWFKSYGFADGHAEIKPEPEEGFQAWEEKHMTVAPVTGP